MLYIVTSHHFDTFHGMVIDEYDEVKICLSLSDAQEFMMSEINSLLIMMFKNGIFLINAEFSSHGANVKGSKGMEENYYSYTIHEIEMDKDAE